MPAGDISVSATTLDASVSGLGGGQAVSLTTLASQLTTLRCFSSDQPDRPRQAETLLGQFQSLIKTHFGIACESRVVGSGPDDEMLQLFIKDESETPGKSKVKVVEVSTSSLHVHFDYATICTHVKADMGGERVESGTSGDSDAPKTSIAAVPTPRSNSHATPLQKHEALQSVPFIKCLKGELTDQFLGDVTLDGEARPAMRELVFAPNSTIVEESSKEASLCVTACVCLRVTFWYGCAEGVIVCARGQIYHGFWQGVGLVHSAFQE